MSDNIKPIAPEKAQQILETAIRERLGDDWQDEDSGWAVITSHAYMARLNRGRINVDFYVDLLGNVTVETKEISPAQDSGRLVAWLLLLLSLAIAFLLARIAGLL